MQDTIILIRDNLVVRNNYKSNNDSTEFTEKYQDLD